MPAEQSTSLEEFRSSKFVEVVTLPPVPHVESNTIRFEAGAVSFGVEYRALVQVEAAVQAAKTAALAS